VSWTASREKDVVGYELVYGPVDGEPRGKLDVEAASVEVGDLQAGDQVMVRAINARGLHGWDWARAVR